MLYSRPPDVIRGVVALARIKYSCTREVVEIIAGVA